VRKKVVGTIDGMDSAVARGGARLHGRSGLGGIRGGLWEVCEAVHGEVAWSGDHERTRQNFGLALLPSFLHIWVIGWSYPYMGIWVKFWVIIQKKYRYGTTFGYVVEVVSFASLPIKKQFLAKISTFLVSFGDARIM
jgi:hypothetical protein